MKKLMTVLFASSLLLTLACNSAKKTEAGKRHNKEKMDQLEKDKKDFEKKNEKELGK